MHVSYFISPPCQNQLAAVGITCSDKFPFITDIVNSVSLLTDFEQGESYLDWTIGVHGIQITFPHPSSIASSPSSETPSPFSSSYNLPRITSKQSFSATYLPDVIPEQGWDKVEAVDSAIHKAGWRGRITEDLRRSVKLQRYQSKVCKVTWDDYIQWRTEQEGPEQQ